LLAETAVPSDADGLRGLAGRLAGLPVRAVIESMNGARFVHDALEEHGWEVLVADAQKVTGLAPLACKTDRIDARVLAELSWRHLVPAIWLPDPAIRRERELARFRSTWSASHDIDVAPPRIRDREAIEQFAPRESEL
jgi:transposase